MQAAFAVGQADHDEADIEEHRRQDLGQEPSRGATEANPVSGLISHPELKEPFAHRSLPGRAGQQGFIQPLSNKRQDYVNEDGTHDGDNQLGRWLLVSLSLFDHSTYYR